MTKTKRVLIIGLGRFGAALIQELWEAGLEVLVLDCDADAIERSKDRTSAAFVGDATDPDVLSGIGVGELDSVVVSFGRYFEVSVLCVSSLAQLGVPHIIARAETLRQGSILKTVGATRVIQLESDMGKRFAKELIAPVTEELLEVAEHYHVLPWQASGPLVGSTLGEARLRQRFDINVIGYRRRGEREPSGERPRIHIPTGDYRIQEGDSLLIVGEENSVNRFVDEVGE